MGRVTARNPGATFAILSLAMLGLGCTVATVPGLRRVLPPGFIPALDEPASVTADRAARFLEPNEPVVGLEGGEGARAYSLWMLDRREIVNDEIDGEPIAVTWCPLAGSSAVYDRRIGGRTLTFRVSGWLYRDALVLEDRETGTFWSQVDGRAIAGPLVGHAMVPRLATRASWQTWRNLHPGTRVVEKDWWDRRGTSDYASYAADESRLGLSGEQADPRLPPKEIVWGLVEDGDAVAVRLPLSGLLELELDGEAMLVVPDAAGEAARAFVAEHQGRALHFESTAGGTLRDLETGSDWRIPELRAVAGPLAGTALEPVAGRSLYWFAWARFHPESRIVPAPAGTELANGAIDSLSAQLVSSSEPVAYRTPSSEESHDRSSQATRQ